MQKNAETYALLNLETSISTGDELSYFGSNHTTETTPSQDAEPINEEKKTKINKI